MKIVTEHSRKNDSNFVIEIFKNATLALHFSSSGNLVYDSLERCIKRIDVSFYAASVFALPPFSCIIHKLT